MSKAWQKRIAAIIAFRSHVLLSAVHDVRAQIADRHDRASARVDIPSTPAQNVDNQFGRWQVRGSRPSQALVVPKEPPRDIVFAFFFISAGPICGSSVGARRRAQSRFDSESKSDPYLSGTIGRTSWHRLSGFLNIHTIRITKIRNVKSKLLRCRNTNSRSTSSIDI